MREITQQDVAAFIAAEGNSCIDPDCDGIPQAMAGGKNYAENRLYDQVTCDKCGISWHNCYTLDSVWMDDQEVMYPPEPEPAKPTIEIYGDQLVKCRILGKAEFHAHFESRDIAHAFRAALSYATAVFIHRADETPPENYGTSHPEITGPATSLLSICADLLDIVAAEYGADDEREDAPHWKATIARAEAALQENTVLREPESRWECPGCAEIVVFPGLDNPGVAACPGCGETTDCWAALAEGGE